MFHLEFLKFEILKTTNEMISTTVDVGNIDIPYNSR